MATAAVHSAAIEAWCDEEPRNPDALMMNARVQTQRALLAFRKGVSAEHQFRIADLARKCCWYAMRCAHPQDPVPYVCLLALAHVDSDWKYPNRRRPEHFAEPEEPMLPRGPWPLLWEVLRRDPGNREGYQRMLQYFHARGDGGMEFAQWAASRAPEGSAQLTLPLYALAESYQLGLTQGTVITRLGFWAKEPVWFHAERARDGWFAHVSPSTCSLVDLNHLAYALIASGAGGAWPVFEAIGPYATSAPWKQLHTVSYQANQSWKDDFHRARAMAKEGRR
ncbi:hypothetical protein Sipo8835_44410 [Streptomyces ipomoeae]|uniref:Uncharacterized protein n=1 Tax=Streptomyces ipomoeae TaxID=103232 RepID=A0AAE9AVR1_9ACTN|nr:hypothetical protein [Streptomyces ipomoeae]TQE15808.1 hypothetical protein Sipo8835_44410 [Streptomyces ipomoeae]